MILRLLLIAVLVCFCLTCADAREEPAPKAPTFAESLPEFTLKAPDDVEHARKDFIGKGVVMICTAPNVTHGDSQRTWVTRLTKDGWKKDGPALVLLEDMTQSWFKGKAIERMKDEYRPGEAPILLLDHKADLRKALEAKKNALLDKTVVLVYNCEGTLVHVETLPPEKADFKKLYEKIEEVGGSPFDQLPPIGK